MSLEETIKYNKEKVRKFKEMELKRIKKEERKEKILTGIIAIAILTMTIIILNSYNKKQLNNCIEGGNSVNYCKGGM